MPQRNLKALQSAKQNVLKRQKHILLQYGFFSLKLLWLHQWKCPVPMHIWKIKFQSRVFMKIVLRVVFRHSCQMFYITAKNIETSKEMCYIWKFYYCKYKKISQAQAVIFLNFSSTVSSFKFKFTSFLLLRRLSTFLPFIILKLALSLFSCFPFVLGSKSLQT